MQLLIVISFLRPIEYYTRWATPDDDEPVEKDEETKLNENPDELSQTPTKVGPYPTKVGPYPTKVGPYPDELPQTPTKVGPYPRLWQSFSLQLEGMMSSLVKFFTSYDLAWDTMLFLRVVCDLS